VKLAGIEPTAGGYRIAPHLPFASYALRLPRVGVEVRRRSIRGYVTPESGGTLVMRVAIPPRLDPARMVTWAGGRRVRHARAAGRTVVFRLAAKAGPPGRLGRHRGR